MTHNLTKITQFYSCPSQPQQQIAPSSLMYQRDEVTQTCCLIGSFTKPRDSTPSARRQYAHSVTAKSKDKKINLLIGKKGTSVQKTAGISLTKNIITNNTRSYKTIKTKPQYNNAATTIGSKDVTQKNSLCNSRMRPEPMLKIQRTNTTTQGHSSQALPLKPSSEITFQTHTREMSNVHLLSDITLVEEEFISHGSTTLNALNYLANCNTEKSRFCEQANSTIKLISNYPMNKDTIKEFRNPLERLTERKLENEKKRLVL